MNANLLRNIYCNMNQKTSFHCEHQELTTGGLKSRCCWCGVTWDQETKVPEHGNFAPRPAGER